MANVNQLEQIFTAAVSHALLERAELLNQFCNDGKMFVSKHIVGQQNLLSPCKEPTHEVNSVMDIAGQHIEVFFEISKCGFIGPLRWP